jgi:pantoate--beta-alanine ligase
VRDDDGMALSSRNAYLSAADRAAGLALSRALRAGAAAAEQGVAAVLSAATGVLAAEPAAAIDYLALVDDRTWEPADDSTTLARLLVAARVGTTRLIDNVVLLLGTTSAPSRAEG